MDKKQTLEDTTKAITEHSAIAINNLGILSGITDNAVFLDKLQAVHASCLVLAQLSVVREAALAEHE